LKNQRIFPGIIFVSLGAYFFLQKSNVILFENVYTWPSLLIIIGLAFLFQGYGGKDYEAILPGVVLSGFGLHFHIINHLSLWSDTTGIYILIIALGFLLRHQKTGTGLSQGVLLLALSGLLLFYERVLNWIGLVNPTLQDIVNKFWPLALLFIGGYLLLKKKK
jgi:hypothetical protein